MIPVRKSTARAFLVGPILDAAGALVTDAVKGDLQISKRGGAPAALNASATLGSHLGGGTYILTTAAGDNDTPGNAAVVCIDSNNSMPVLRWLVVNEAWYWIASDGSATGDGLEISPVNTLSTAITAGGKRFKWHPRNAYNNEGDNDFITLGAVNIPARGSLDFNGCVVADMQAPNWVPAVGAYLFSSSIMSRLLGSGAIDLPQDGKFVNLEWQSGDYTTNYGYWFASTFYSAASLTLEDNAGATSRFYGVDFGDPSTPFAITLSGADANTKVQISYNSSGNLKIKGMKTASRVEHQGSGRLVIDSTCVGGIIYCTSHVDLYESDGTTKWDRDNVTNRPTIVPVSLLIAGALTPAANTEIAAETAAVLAAAHGEESWEGGGGSIAGDYRLRRDDDETFNLTIEDA